MKTIKRILGSAGLVAMMFSAASCDLTQPAQSAFNPDEMYANPTLVEMNIFGVYECLGETNSHRGRYLLYYGLNTDTECYGSTNFDGKLDIAAYNCLPTNSQLDLANGPFTKLAEGIERANVCIEGIRTYGNTPEMKPLLGEALVARAFLYVELLKAYGEVPFRFSPVTSETLYLNKADRDDIYLQLLADLREAIPYLDGVKQAKTDRVTKAFAEGLFARVALMASGYSWRPDKGEVGTGNAGSNRLSDVEELSKSVLYPEAYTYLVDAIENGGFSLYDNYEQLWRDFNNMSLASGKEVMFSIPFSNARGRWNYSFAVRKESGGMNDTWCKFGDSRGGSAGPTPYLYYKYKKGDVRRDVSCVNWKWNDQNPTKQVPAGQMNWYFGKFRFEWMTAQPYTGGNDDGIKPVYMRFADVLLMAAEIGNELGKPEAAGYFKQVRTRAFGGNESLAMEGINVSDKDAFFQAIKDERALEFVGEMIRKQDLIRWGELKARLDYAKEEIVKCAKMEGEYSGHGPAVWYSYDANGEIVLYGVAPGEIADETKFAGEDEWELESKEYFKENDSVTKRVASIYKEGVDPEQRMWWPIPATVITNYQGALKNDYNY